MILIKEGNNNKEEIKAITKIIVDSIPNSELGLKLENNNTMNPIAKVIVVLIIALPVVKIVTDVDFSWDLEILNSERNLDKKWIVSSTAIPRAIEKVMAVAGLNSIPIKPIIPPANIRGRILGIIDTKESLKDLNRIIIDIKIIEKAIIKLLNKLLIRYLFIFNDNRVLPVILIPSLLKIFF